MKEKGLASKVSLVIFILSIGILIGSVVNISRQYQDSWLLEGLELQTLLLTLSYLSYYFFTKDIDNLSLVSCVYLLSLHIIPGLKYFHSYGVAVDLGFHISNLTSLISFGKLELGTVYSDQPGIYLSLLSLRTFFNISAENIIKFGPGILSSFLPLYGLIIARSISMPSKIIRYVPLCSVIAFDPYFFILQGSTFGSLILLLIILTLFSREKSSSEKESVYWTSLLFLLMIVIVITHAITSLVTIALFIVIALVYYSISRFSRQIKLSLQKYSTIWLSMVGIVFAVLWWGYKSNLLLTVIIQKFSQIIQSFNFPSRPPIPDKFFSLSIIDQGITFLFFHAAFLVVLALVVIGLLYIRISHQEQRTKRAYIWLEIMLLSFLVVIVFQLLFKIGQIEYYRFITYFVVLAPLVMANGVILLERFFKHQIYIFCYLFALLIIAFMQIFIYQPALPRSPIIKSTLGIDEPVVYLHSVITDYETSMLNFASQHFPEKSIIGADIYSSYAAISVWSLTQVQTIGLESASSTNDIFYGRWQIFLYHHPGRAGALFEQDQYRIPALTDPLLWETPVGMPYDNGGAFIVTRANGNGK